MFSFLGGHFFIKRHMHVPTCTWGMWSENIIFRVDTHGAMKKNLSRFGDRNPEKFNFEYLVFHKKRWGKRHFLVFWEFFLIKRHVNVPRCTWGMWSENIIFRVDTHGAMKKNLSRFGGRNPEKFNFENLVFYRNYEKKVVFWGNFFS